MGKAVRVVVIGNSYASRVQLPALRHAGRVHGDVEVVGIAGRDLERARATAAAWGIAHATTDYRDLLALDPDLVVIATPVDLHAPMVRDALQTRAAILCEKPFTLTVEEAEELTDRARGRLCLLDHQLRASPYRLRLQQLVREGAVGDVFTARSEMLFGSSRHHATRPHWWYDAARGGGTLGAICSHLLDALLLEVGDVTSVRADLSTFVPRRDDGRGGQLTVTADEHAELWLRLASGARATVAGSVMAPHGTGSLVEVTGSLGTARLVDEEALWCGRHDGELLRVDVTPGIPPKEATGAPTDVAFARLEPVYMAQVVAAVRAGRSTLPGAATFADGLKVMRILAAARRSHASAGWVAV